MLLNLFFQIKITYNLIYSLNLSIFYQYFTKNYHTSKNKSC